MAPISPSNGRGTTLKLPDHTNDRTFFLLLPASNQIAPDGIICQKTGKPGAEISRQSRMHRSTRILATSAASADSLTELDRSWHSQIVSTFHPDALSLRAASRSLRWLLSNLVRQKSCRLFGMYANAHPLWRCQKHPWTKTRVRYFGSTISGRPGKSALCSRKRRPAACRALRTSLSG